MLLLETAPHSFIYSILQHSGESAVSERSFVGCSPKFTCHQNTPKAGGGGWGGNNHKCICEFNSLCWSCLDILFRSTLWQPIVYLLRRTCAMAARGCITSAFHPPPPPLPPTPQFLPHRWARWANNHRAHSSCNATACRRAPEAITTLCQLAHFPSLSHRSAAKLV